MMAKKNKLSNRLFLNLAVPHAWLLLLLSFFLIALSKPTLAAATVIASSDSTQATEIIASYSSVAQSLSTFDNNAYQLPSSSNQLDDIESFFNSWHPFLPSNEYSCQVPDFALDLNANDFASYLPGEDFDLESIEDNNSIFSNEPNIITDAPVGDECNIKVRKLARLLPDSIPQGRIDYRCRFVYDLRSFEKGTSTLHHGKLKADLYLINYHDVNKELGFGPGKRTMIWATHIEAGRCMASLEEVCQRLALVKPELGERNSIAFIRIPKGTEVTFISGKVLGRVSKITGEAFSGGGLQLRFRDFDPNWIVLSKPLIKAGN